MSEHDTITVHTNLPSHWISYYNLFLFGIQFVKFTGVQNTHSFL